MVPRTGHEAAQSPTAGATTPASDPGRLSGDDLQAAVIVQIKAEMSTLDWTQPDLTAASGIPRSTLHRYLSGARDLPLPVVAEVANALGVTLGELLERAQNRFDAMKAL